MRPELLKIDNIEYLNRIKREGGDAYRALTSFCHGVDKNPFWGEIMRNIKLTKAMDVINGDLEAIEARAICLAIKAIEDEFKQLSNEYQVKFINREVSNAKEEKTSGVGGFRRTGK